MEKKWTDEPWPQAVEDTHTLYERDADLHVQLSERNYERARTCVNACARIGNPEAIGALVEALLASSEHGPSDHHATSGAFACPICAALADLDIKPKDGA